jgi:hypothetical protein
MIFKERKNTALYFQKLGDPFPLHILKIIEILANK